MAERLRVFKNAWFQRFARKEKIADAALWEAVIRADKGLIDADLGGGLIKQRIARPGSGKSGGYRTLIFFRAKARAVFAFGFAKSDMDNIDEDDEADMKKAAKLALGFSEAEIGRLVAAGTFVEAKCDDQADPTRIYRSEVAAAVHEMVEGFHDAGLIDKQTMREFDSSCLSPALPIAPEEIKAIRERERVSQPVFARYLNVSKNLVSDWERGAKRPGGPALRLLAVVRKNGLRAIA